MRINSLDAPCYLPEQDQRSVLRLGLMPLEPRSWLLPNANLAEFHQHKLDCLERYQPQTCVTLPGSEDAQSELHDLMLLHLIQDHPTVYRREAGQLCHLSADLRWKLGEKSLWQCSLWVTEDLCILEPRGDEYVLTAASVCSPSNWKLEDKIGRNVDFIHGPVPGYERELAQRVNRLFAGLKPEKPLARMNWSVQNDNELLWRKDLGLGTGTTQTEQNESTATDKYWRVERQTLRRLPGSGAVVFTIGISLHSFQSLSALPGFTDAMAAILQQLPEEQKLYKGLS